jgi:hypothetical protein
MRDALSARRSYDVELGAQTGGSRWAGQATTAARMRHNQPTPKTATPGVNQIRTTDQKHREFEN